MPKRNLGLNTICTHEGAVKDVTYGGATSPIYISTSYEFIGKPSKRYPRYFNTPNQEFLAKKVAGVESTMILPSKTSHALLSVDEREAQGITDQLIRFSVGIESKKDLIYDIKNALIHSKK